MPINFPNSRLTFKEVKAHAIYFLLELEKQGKVTREDGYQGILNAIAGDVRSKHRKRLQRQQELESMTEALKHLSERKKYYEEQIKSYNNYVEAAMNTMQRGKRYALIFLTADRFSSPCSRAAKNDLLCPSQNNSSTCEICSGLENPLNSDLTNTVPKTSMIKAFSFLSTSTLLDNLIAWI